MAISKFAYRLRDLRRNSNISGQKLGESLGVGKTTISAWENGVNYPNQETLIKIAEYFNVSVDYLLGVPSKKTVENVKDDDDFLVAFYGEVDKLPPETQKELKKTVLDFVKILKEKEKGK
jgi:transcriptional regulator with XRE-family HTH domain